MKKILNIIFKVAIAAFFIVAIGMIGTDELQTYQAKGDTITYHTDDNKNVYIICDIEYFENGNGNTEINCVMPDGSIQEYIVEDAPEECTEVCFKVKGKYQNNYSKYEVVAIR